MKVKGLGCLIKKQHIINMVVPATEAIPYCPRHVSGGKLGLIYYDRIGHCIRAEPGVFYFEANMRQKSFNKLLALLEKGFERNAYELLKETGTGYLETS